MQKCLCHSTVTELLSVSAVFFFGMREGTVGDQKFFNFVFVNALVFCVIYRRGAAVSGVGEGYEGKFINCFGILIRLTLKKWKTNGVFDKVIWELFFVTF